MPILGGNTNVEVNIKINADTKQVDDAKGKVEGFGGSLQRVGEIAAGMGLARLGEQFLEMGKNAAMFAIDTASQFQQWKVAFDVMLGSSTKASALLKDLSDFAVKTPFNLPQVVEGAQRLLAYNVEAEKIIPTFQMLGDISAGVGTEKLPQLILAFGQVKAATKLTGMELRQFSETGVPLLGALVDQFNEQGGVLTKVGGLTKAQTKSMTSLTSAVVDQEYRMKLLTDANKNSGVSWEMLKHKYEQNKTKLAEFGAVGQATYQKVKVSAAEMIEKISKGAVKFEDVEKALKKMTEKGGKYFDLMGLQAETYDGRLNNIKDSFIRIAAEIMGVSMDKKTFGEIKEGSIFDRMTKSAEQFMTFMDKNKPTIVAIFSIIGNAVLLVANILAVFVKVVGFLIEHTNILIPVLGALGTIIMSVLLPALVAWMAMLWTYITVTVPALILAHLPIILIAAAVGAAIFLLMKAWESNWGNIRGITESVVNAIIGMINIMIDGINWAIDGLNKLWKAAGNKNDLMGKIGKIGTVTIQGAKSVAAPAVSNFNPSNDLLKGIDLSKLGGGTTINQTNNIQNMVDMQAVNRDLGWQLR